MATFPDTTHIKPLLGYDSGLIENVRRNPSEAGASQIRDLWAGERKFYAEFDMDLSAADSRTVIAFNDANYATTFDFYDYDPSVGYTTELIGTGDGATLTFNIPAKETTSRLVYVNGVLKTVVTHYNITAGTGPIGQDRAVFTAGNAPPNGHAVTISYVGRHHFECEFMAFTRPVIGSTGRKRFHIRVEEAW